MEMALAFSTLLAIDRLEVVSGARNDDGLMNSRQQVELTVLIALSNLSLKGVLTHYRGWFSVLGAACRLQLVRSLLLPSGVCASPCGSHSPGTAVN